ncbi:tetratricopeptide (TPR) repeat protein [Actinomadura coerulea]|uniref:Tetratricopeptide repeat protein 38 n=1 Tax=Actinomadura coerulea TaxID=46159 RepID=A0A7X0FXH4_9ACTN|nr:tetratricopeptide repeat protein [Actinomadura coerulea]MBB6395559.1 tetratricopeptide (TPR) repeat protein [Actinomadura coerulea]GGQ25422.1 tetratricopeptide repeat protein 38 family protein [Actinomadura coerulea]
MAMKTDEHGLALGAGSSTAVEHYDNAIHELLHFRPEVDVEAKRALEADPDFPLGNVLSAYLELLSTEPDGARAAAERFRRFRSRVDGSGLLARERAHLAALERLVKGDFLGCGRLLGRISEEYPRDVLALFVGHQIDYFTGDARALRDRVGGALTAWSETDRHFGQLLGMYAFGLEEAGHYDRSEEVGLRAVGLDPKDVWGIHAVVHTYEMQGRFRQGIAYMDERLTNWSTGTFFNVHAWWHYALYALEAGDTARALEIYDAVLHGPDSTGTAMELLDAAALLWRLFLEGDDQTARWNALADGWASKAREPFYAFNDMHAVMSFVGAGRLGDADRLIADREAYLSAPLPDVTNQAMTARVGLPVCRALVAFGRGDHTTVVDLLAPIRHHVNEFGGSHAQRDAVQKTLLEAALRSRRLDLARVLVSERISVRPSSPFNWLKHADVAEALGDAATATTARTHAMKLRRP